MSNDSLLVFGPEEKRKFWAELYINDTQDKSSYSTDYHNTDTVLSTCTPKLCFVYDHILNLYKSTLSDLINNTYYTWVLIGTDPLLSDILMQEFDNICFILEERCVSVDMLDTLKTNSGYLKKLTFDKAQLQKKDKEHTSFKQNLLSNVSHELRTPLNGILGFATLLVEDSLSSDQRESMQVIIDSSNRLIKVIDNLLDHLDISTNKINLVETECDLVKIAFSAYKSCLKDLQGKHIDLIFDIKQAHLWIEADQNKLRVVLEHLISNAIKFTSSGSIIVRINPLLHDFVSIDVIDSGCGISPEIVSNLYKAFHQGDGSITREYGGTGLGLFIAYKYINLMRGEICAKNNATVGCTFSVIIPIKLARKLNVLESNVTNKSVLVLSESSAIKTLYSHYKSNKGYQYHLSGQIEKQDFLLVDFCTNKDLSTATIKIIETARSKKIPCFSLLDYNNVSQRHLSDQMKFDDFYTKPFHPDSIELVFEKLTNTGPKLVKLPDQSLNILVLEDERVSQVLFKRCLEAKGHKATIFNSGQKALNNFKVGYYDLMIVDLHVPHMNGYDFAKSIRKIDGKIPIIATSASILEDTKNTCLKSGMTDLLPKPFLKLDLHNILYKHTGIGALENYHQYRILHIDDEEHVLDIVSCAISHSLLGINIKTSDNAIEACTLLGSFQPHIVITDMNMPQMDGLTFVRYLKSDPLYSSTKVFVLTGLSQSNENIIEVNKMGIEKTLYKPLKANDLVAHLKKTLDKL